MIRDLVKQSYNMRSNIVHGAAPSKRKPDQVKKITDDTLEILRAALRRWIDPTTDRSENALDDALLS